MVRIHLVSCSNTADHCLPLLARASNDQSSSRHGCCLSNILWFLGYRSNILKIKNWYCSVTRVKRVFVLCIYFYFIVNHLSIQCGFLPGSDFLQQSKDMHVRSLGFLKLSVGVECCLSRVSSRVYLCLAH